MTFSSKNQPMKRSLEHFLVKLATDVKKKIYQIINFTLALMKKKKESWMSCCPKKSTQFTQAFLTFLNDRSVYAILLRRLKNKVSLHKLRKTILFYRIVWYGAVMPNISFRPRRLGGKLWVANFLPKADLIFERR